MTSEILSVLSIILIVAQVLITFNYKKLKLDGELLLTLNIFLFIIILVLSQAITYYEDIENHNLSGYVIIIE